MDRIKFFSGSIAEDTATMSIKSYYGAASNITAKRSKTELLNKKLLEFLSECGAEAEYDGNFLWVNKVPLVIYFTGTNTYSITSLPFFSSSLFYGSSASAIFSGLNYNFKARLLGEPTSAFALMVSTGYAAPAFSSSTFNIAFYKAENIINKKESRVFGTRGYSNNNELYNMRAIDLDDNGMPIDIGRVSYSSTVAFLETISGDFGNNRNKYPLVEWMQNIFKVDGCYYGLKNDPLPQAAATYADAQTFMEIGGDVYFRLWNGPFIKCIT